MARASKTRHDGSRPTGVKCPKCKSEIVYNGNYFCERWGDTCDWALSHDDRGNPIGRTDRRVWREIFESEFFKESRK